mgnify:CR=1 FL=1
MRLIGIHVLADFKSTHSDAASQIDTWVAEVKNAEWQTPHELKRRYPSASIPVSGNVVFNFKGNRYRLHVLISYQNQIITVVRFGTHDQYMRWIY